MVEEHDDDIPVLSLEDPEIEENDGEAVENAVKGSIRYAFIGSGQGGSRLAAEAYKIGYRKTICINTAPQDLSAIQIPEEQKLCLDIGPGGAGKDPARGEEATTKHQQAIYNLMKQVFGKQIDHIMICAGAGGGSGGGSVLPLIMIAKRYLQFLGHVEDLDKRVGVVLTLPTNSEVVAVRVAWNAYQVASKVSDLAEAGSIAPLVVVDNDKVLELRRGIPMVKMWPTVNFDVMNLFHIFNLLSLKHSSYTSFDPSDYASVVKAGGHTIMGVTSVKPEQAQNETEIMRVVKSSLDRTLLADGFDLSTATHVAAIVMAGRQTLEEVPGLAEVIEYVFSMLGTLTSAQLVHRGVYEDSRPGLRIYTIVSGLQRPLTRYRRLETLSRERYPFTER
jgi:cell division GTPase FtsZ